LLAAALAGGQEPRRGGTVDLQFDLHTHPGGAPANPALGINTINVHLTISATGIRVDRDGKFSFEAQGEYHLDSFGAFGGTLTNNERRHDTLKGTGTIAEDNTLTLQLEWTHGPGLLIYTANPPGGTYTAHQPAVATPHVMQWKLAPASRQVEEPGPDQVRETIKYKSRRASTVVGTQAAPMTERVEVTHVRHMKLVPRG
jgi:hypothetical protein